MKTLYRKYIVRKANGQDIDDDADYFVLRLDTDPHARAALRAYAESVRATEPEFAAELRDRVDYWRDKGGDAREPYAGACVGRSYVAARDGYYGDTAANAVACRMPSDPKSWLGFCECHAAWVECAVADGFLEHPATMPMALCSVCEKRPCYFRYNVCAGCEWAHST